MASSTNYGHVKIASSIYNPDAPVDCIITCKNLCADYTTSVYICIYDQEKSKQTIQLDMSSKSGSGAASIYLRNCTPYNMVFTGREFISCSGSNVIIGNAVCNGTSIAAGGSYSIMYLCSHASASLKFSYILENKFVAWV